MGILSHPLVPVPTDGLDTETSDSQAEVEELIFPLVTEYLDAQQEDGFTLPAEKDVRKLKLERSQHIQYLTPNLFRPLFPYYASLDASRSWIMYWCLHSLALLNATLDPRSKTRAIETLRQFSPRKPGEQTWGAGFGGGPGQIPHLATTYAAVLALAYVGSQDDWRQLDRKGMLEWLLNLKQEDGSFVMHKGGEVDVRGCYCAMSVAVLLNIATPELTKDVANFVASCQTYEGGLASASHSYQRPTPYSPPLGEAHGGYTFCAVASYFMALPSGRIKSEQSKISASPDKTLDIPSLLRWSASMQALPSAGGGFQGRTNKLVDGCYSWWNGGIFTIIRALMEAPLGDKAKDIDDIADLNLGTPPAKEEEWEDEEDPRDMLFDREALQQYVLIAAQVSDGGLRDKPGKNPDAYHTCYNLSGLSGAQHKMFFDQARERELRSNWIVPQTDGPSSIALIKGLEETDVEAKERMKGYYARTLAWREIEESKLITGVKDNEAVVTHPTLNITMTKVREVLDFFYEQELVIES